MDEAEETAKGEGDDAAKQVVAWLRATADDLSGLDFEAPLAGARSADCRDLCDFYRATIRSNNDSAAPPGTPANRVFAMLTAITAMHFAPEQPNVPFGPMFVLQGSRSAIPSDFRSHVGLLALMAERAYNPVLRARLSDLSWVLDRKRGDMAVAAISAYVNIIAAADRNELKYRFANEGDVLRHEARDCLQRALWIGRSTGWDKPEVIAAREMCERLRKRALTDRVVVPALWFCELDLDFGVTDATIVAAALDELLANVPVDAPSHIVVDLWRLAGRAYHLAKKQDESNRCIGQAAERLVLEAQRNQSSIMLAAHLVSSAIAQLHGIPGKKDRRTELRHQLVELQARVQEELSEVSGELDIGEIAENVQKAVCRGSLLDKLLLFAVLERSPDPGQLVKDAVTTVKKHPFASLFGTSHLDDEGKVVSRSNGVGLSDAPDESAIRCQIAQTESFRRGVAASAKIEPARLAINREHFISDDIFIRLLRYSFFVPPDLLERAVFELNR